MPMIWDAPLVSALARELANRLEGDRLRGHRFLWDEREITLFFRSGTLRWALHPEKGWPTLDPPVDLPSDARPLSAQLRKIFAPPDERLLEMRLRRARGTVREIRVVFELMTNQWNALLLDGEEGQIRHLLWTRDLEDRPLVVGRQYRAPPPSTRRGIRAPLSPDEWAGLLLGKNREVARRTLLEEVAFSSPINLPDLIPHDGGEADQGPDGLPVPSDAPLKTEELNAGYALWTALRTQETPSPCVLEIGRDKQPYHIIIKRYKHTRFPDLLSAIQAVGQGSAEGSERGEALLKEVGRALMRASKKVSGIRREMEESSDPQEPRDQANLLLARLAQVPRGAPSVTLEGFMGEAVEIPLDPALSPRENAEALYGEAARRERARDRLPPLLEEAMARCRILETLREGLTEGTVSPQEAQALLPQSLKMAPGKKQGERLPYRVFWSSGGLEIRVGRGPRENDTLTFRHSGPDDVWLHARDTAGAHVILRWRGEDNPPRRDLEEAAILAALHSAGRGSAMVPVDWTRRKHVRKPRKAPPGTVIPQHVQTLFVEPDPTLPERLIGPRPSPS